LVIGALRYWSASLVVGGALRFWVLVRFAFGFFQFCFHLPNTTSAAYQKRSVPFTTLYFRGFSIPMHLPYKHWQSSCNLATNVSGAISRLSGNALIDFESQKPRDFYLGAAYYRKQPALQFLILPVQNIQKTEISEQLHLLFPDA
jgi:hypothetical protein